MYAHIYSLKKESSTMSSENKKGLSFYMAGKEFLRWLPKIWIFKGTYCFSLILRGTFGKVLADAHSPILALKKKKKKPLTMPLLLTFKALRLKLKSKENSRNLRQWFAFKPHLQITCCGSLEIYSSRAY